MEQDETARQDKKAERIHRALCTILGKPVSWYFGYSYDSLANIPDPYLLVCNHVTDIDPAFVGLATWKRARFVATEQMLNLGFASKLLVDWFHPIIHTKGKRGVRSATEILKTLRRGKSVILFAEGSRSFNGLTGEIPEVTAKLAKKSGAALVTYRLSGGYLTQPRWSTTFRRGCVEGHLGHVISAEELSSMSNDEVIDLIRQDLHEDAFEHQRSLAAPVRYRGKHLALGLESTLFACPCCGRFATMTSDDTSISCSCGMRATYGETGMLKVASNPIGTLELPAPFAFGEGDEVAISDWDAWQNELLGQVIAGGNVEGAAASDLPLFSDEVSVFRIGEDHAREQVGEGVLEAFATHANFSGEAYDAERIQGYGAFGRNTLTVHLAEGSFEIRGNQGFNALKYMYWIEHLRRMVDTHTL